MKRLLLPCLLLALALSGSSTAFASTLYARSLQDSGPNSLRQAIADANPGDTIAFSVKGTITLASPLVIAKSLTIQGPGAGLLTISGNNAVRVFQIQSGPVTLDGLTIAQGNSGPSSNGGAIWNSASLTVSHSTVSGSSAFSGGGIYSTGTLSVSKSMFSGNSSQWGGAIYSSGPLTVIDSTASGNSAYHGGGGIMCYASTLTVKNSTISGNSTIDTGASGNGGGIFSSGTLTVSNSILTANRGNLGGAIRLSDGTGTISGSTVSGNSANWEGGGIDLYTGTLVVSNSTFSGNSVSRYTGGGIYFFIGTLEVSNSTFSGNSANTKGGAIFSGGLLTVNASTVSGNSANDEGGGIYFYSGTLGVSNSTFSGNSANSGGGVFIARDTARVSNSTFSGNSADSGGGIRNNQPGTLTIGNTILANSPSGGNLANFGTVNDQGYNLDSQARSPLTASSDRIGVDPLLGRLQNNGGPTQTHALLPGSSAIDTGNNANAPATDQRGLTRIADGKGSGSAVIDIGAYEFQPAADLSISLSATPSSVANGASLLYTISVQNLGPTAAAGMVITDALPLNTVFLGASATSGKLSTPPVGSPGILYAQLGTLASGAKVTVTLTVKVELKKGTITNSATVSSSVTDPVMGNNSSTVFTSVK